MVQAALYVAMVLILVLAWAFALWRPRELSGLSRPRPLLIGHRGVRTEATENTVEALRLALERGLDGVEFDVQRTRDGTLVLYHDFHLPDGRPLTALGSAEIAAANTGLATLEEALKVCLDHPGTLINIELKAEGLITGGLEREAARLAAESGMADRVLISSFNPLSLGKVRLAAPSLRTALLYSPQLPWPLNSGALARWLHVDAIHPHFELVTPELLRWARSRGLMVNTWTVNDPAVVRGLVELTVDGIVADDPQAVRSAAGRE